MGYVIHLWERPLPASLTEALAIQSRLARLRKVTNAKFATLVAQLTAVHPDITEGDDDDDGDPGVWSDGPLMGNAAGHLMSIGVQTHAIDTVLPFVVERARALGLAVLDEQSGRVYLPDGSILHADGRARPLPDRPLPPSTRLQRTEVRRLLMAALGPQLTAAGFSRVSGDGDYCWTTPAARFQVKVELESYHDGFHASVPVAIVLPGARPDPLLQYLYPDGAEMHVHAHRLATDAGLAWPEASSSFTSATYLARRDEVVELASRWSLLFREAILPLLRDCASLQGLERAVNGKPQAFHAGSLGVALAAAAGRDDLEAVAEAHAPWQQERAHSWALRLIEQLRTPPTAELGQPATYAGLDPEWLLPLLRSGRPRLPLADDGQLRPVEHQPVMRGFVGHLFVLMVAAPADPKAGAPRYVQMGQLEPTSAFAPTPEALHALALENLRRLARAGLRRETEGALMRLRLDGRFDASLMLLDEVWDAQLADQTPGGALVAVPQPGMLLYCDVAAPRGLPELRARVAQLAAGSSDTLSRQVFYRSRGAWEALPDRS